MGWGWKGIKCSATTHRTNKVPFCSWLKYKTFALLPFQTFTQKTSPEHTPYINKIISSIDEG